MKEKGYVFDPGHQDERERLGVIEEYLDAHSKRWLTQRGVRDGWHCLDVGSGGGSIARWLCRTVGPSGRVVATDLDTRFLDDLPEPNLEVRVQDVFAEDFPRAEFDLVHSRFLLEHLHQREAALRQLVRAAKPGGWIVVTDSGGTYPASLSDPEEFERVGRAMAEAVTQAGWDFEWAPRMGEEMRGLGLEEVGAEAFRSYETGGSSGFTRLSWDTFGFLRDAIAATGLTDAKEVERVRAMLLDPKRSFVSFETWTAWGRRPG